MSGFPLGLRELLPASTIATWTAVAEATTQHNLDPTIPTAGVEVAGLRDLFAMKLKVIADRGELRDYFDLLTLERRTDLRAETMLPLFVERYRPRIPRQAVATIVLGLGYLGDVGDDPTLPLSRSDIEAYWQHRQPEIGQAMHHGFFEQL